jgi:ketol-acid reductoisomerase
MENAAMNMRVSDQTEIDPDALTGKTVAVIGYGNQGHAHALNLRDSGVHVIVGQRPGGPNHKRALDDGFEPISASDAAQSADLLIMTLPDEAASEVYATEIEPAIRKGKTLGFVHGFNIRFGFIEPPDDVDCIMIAPKGPGTLLRSLYTQGKGLPSLLAVERDASGQARKTALGWAHAIGSTRAAVVETTFAAETEADLFGEQVVLCGGVTALMKAAFETLTEAGFEPELAYIECIHELKQVVDLVYESGISAMREKISNTAEYGDLTRGPRIITDAVRKEMRRILAEVQDGSFANEWLAEFRRKMPVMKECFEKDRRHPMESAGKAVRSLMPWLNSTDKDH